MGAHAADAVLGGKKVSELSQAELRAAQKSKLSWADVFDNLLEDDVTPGYQVMEMAVLQGSIFHFFGMSMLPSFIRSVLLEAQWT